MKKGLFKAPYISKQEIIKEVDNFRKQYWSVKIPVNVEAIIEQKLGIEIIPVPNLMKLCFVDAIITSDWEKIIVDNDKYMDERGFVARITN